MAEPKTLHTRIINKNATAEEWASSNLTLKKGEIALAQITSAESGNYDVPTYAMKIGDGTHTFSQLNWLVAPASDVYDWAKKRSLEYKDLPLELKDKLTALGNVTNVMNFRGAFANISDVDNPEIGDVVVITAGVDSGKEFVYSTLPYVVCDTASNEANKVITIDGFVLSIGKKIVVKFTNTNTATNPNLVIITTGSTNYTKQINYSGTLEAGKLYTFEYNGAQWDVTGDGKDWVEFGQETVISNIAQEVATLKNNTLKSGTAINIDNTSHTINLLYDSNYFSIDETTNKLKLLSSVLTREVADSRYLSFSDMTEDNRAYIIDCGGAT